MMLIDVIHKGSMPDPVVVVVGGGGGGGGGGV